MGLGDRDEIMSAMKGVLPAGANIQRIRTTMEVDPPQEAMRDLLMPSRQMRMGLRAGWRARQPEPELRVMRGVVFLLLLRFKPLKRHKHSKPKMAAAATDMSRTLISMAQHLQPHHNSLFLHHHLLMALDVQPVRTCHRPSHHHKATNRTHSLNKRPLPQTLALALSTLDKLAPWI